MKRKILTAALVFFAIVIKAQNPPPPPSPPPVPPTIEERMQNLSELMKKDMTLDEKQQLAIMEAFKNFFYAAGQVRKDNPPPPPPPPDAKVKAAMDKLEKERDEAIKKVLTADQFEKFKQTEIKMRPPAPPVPPTGKDGKAPPPKPK